MDTENKEILTEENTTEELSEEATTTLDVDTADIDAELQRYGVDTESEAETEEEETKKKKPFIIQSSVIIAAICFVLVACIVFGTLGVYNLFFRKGIDGVWQSDVFAEGVYFVFDKKGAVAIDAGGMRYEGTYIFEESEDGTYSVKSDLFYAVQMYTDHTVTFGEGKKSMTWSNEYYTINFTKSKLPDYKIDAETITHASADELGITAFKTDDALVGKWTEQLDESSVQMGYPKRTLVFEKDGTGSERYHFDLTASYGFEYDAVSSFKYTVHNGAVYITSESYSGDKMDSVIESYSINGNTLITPDGRYTRVDK